MRKIVAFFLILIAAVDLGVYVAGPPVLSHTVSIPYHPQWVPAAAALLIPGEPATAPIPLPPNSYSGLGSVPGFFAPQVQDLWVGSHSYVWPYSAAGADRWARRHLGNLWQSILQGRRWGPHQQTVYELGFKSRVAPHEVLYLTLQALSRRRTLVTIQVQSLQIPNRPPSSYLPLDPRSARIVYRTYRPSQQAIVVTKTATVESLLASVNGGHVVPMGVGDCGAADTWDATLDFRYAGGATRSVQYAPSCGWIVVGQDRSTPFEAGNLSAMMRRIARQAGLPLP